jgi:hypothetical protein
MKFRVAQHTHLLYFDEAAVTGSPGVAANDADRGTPFQEA